MEDSWNEGDFSPLVTFSSAYAAIYVTASAKTVLNSTFGILRNTILSIQLQLKTATTYPQYVVNYYAVIATNIL